MQGYLSIFAFDVGDVIDAGGNILAGLFILEDDSPFAPSGRRVCIGRASGKWRGRDECNAFRETSVVVSVLGINMTTTSEGFGGHSNQHLVWLDGDVAPSKSSQISGKIVKLFISNPRTGELPFPLGSSDSWRHDVIEIVEMAIEARI